MKTKIEVLIDKTWLKYRELLQVNELDKDKFIQALYNNSEKIPQESKVQLYPFIQILEEYLFTYNEFWEFVFSYWNNTKEKDRSFFGPLLLATKVSVDLCAIRSLILTGFAESSQVIFRSVVESLNLLIAMLDDKNLSEEYEESVKKKSGEKQFWYKHISRGKLYKKLKPIVNSLKENKEYFLRQTEYIKNLDSYLSNSVHSSMKSSILIFSSSTIEDKDKFNLSTIGKISGYSPSYILGINHFLDNYLGLFIDYLINNKFYFSHLKRFPDSMNILGGIISRMCMHREVFPLFEDFEESFQNALNDKELHITSKSTRPPNSVGVGL